MADINILIAVDTETLLQQDLSMDKDNPTNVGGDDIFAIVRAADVISGQAGSALNVAARTRDNILWQMTSLTLNAESDAVPYKFTASTGADLLRDDGAATADVTEYVPNPDDLEHPDKQVVKSYYWQVQVLKAGTATYHFAFMIFDRDGNLKGCCTWDPYITIKS